MVKRREDRVLPGPVMDYIDEQSRFCPSFVEQMEKEKDFLEEKVEFLEDVEISGRLFKLTLYVDIAKDNKGRKVAVCGKCSYVYCLANEDIKILTPILRNYESIGMDEQETSN